MSHNGRPRSECKSAICVARLLNAEGFSQHVANEVKRYALRSIATIGQKRRFAKVVKGIREVVMPKLNEADKALLGKFISSQKKMSFETGLRIGLTAFLYGASVSEKEVEELGRLG